MAAPGPPRPGSFLRGCVEPEPAVSGAAAAAGPSSRRRWGLRRGRREGGRPGPALPVKGGRGGEKAEKPRLLSQHLCLSGPAAGKRSGELPVLPPPRLFSGPSSPACASRALPPFSAGLFYPLSAGYLGSGASSVGPAGPSTGGGLTRTKQQVSRLGFQSDTSALLLGL